MTDFTGYGVSVFKRILLDLLLGDVNVVRGIQIIIVRGAKEAITVRHNLQHAGSLDGALEFNSGRPLGLGGLLLRLLRLGLGRSLCRLSRLLLGGRLLLLIPGRFGLLGQVLRLFFLGLVILQIGEQVVDELLSVHVLCGSRIGHRGGRLDLGLFLGLAASLLGLGLLFRFGSFGFLDFLRGGCGSRGCGGSSGVLAGPTAFFGLFGLCGLGCRILGFIDSLRIQNGESKRRQVHFLGSFDVQRLSKGSQLLLAHRIELC